MKSLVMIAGVLLANVYVYAGKPVWIGSQLNQVELGREVTFYDDAQGELTYHIACEGQPDKVEARWSILANELSAPLGEVVVETSWNPPILQVNLKLEPSVVKARQYRLLEIFLQMPQGEEKIIAPAIIFPASEREAIIQRLADERILVDRDLNAVAELLNHYEIKFQSIDVNRSLQAEGPGVYILQSGAALPSNRGASLFYFDNLETLLPQLKIEPGMATFSYFNNLTLLGNAGAERLVLLTTESLCQSPDKINPTPHEEPLF